MLIPPPILIVEDDAAHRAILIYQLTKFGPFKIREAEDGQQALTILAARRRNIIAIDKQLGTQCRLHT